MASSDSQIDKPQRGRPKRAELLDVNINTGAQSINTERASLISPASFFYLSLHGAIAVHGVVSIKKLQVYKTPTCTLHSVILYRIYMGTLQFKKKTKKTTLWFLLKWSLVTCFITGNHLFRHRNSLICSDASAVYNLV